MLIPPALEDSALSPWFFCAISPQKHPSFLKLLWASEGAFSAGNFQWENSVELNGSTHSVAWFWDYECFWAGSSLFIVLPLLAVQIAVLSWWRTLFQSGQYVWLLICTASLMFSQRLMAIVMVLPQGLERWHAVYSTYSLQFGGNLSMSLSLLFLGLFSFSLWGGVFQGCCALLQPFAFCL